MPCPQFSFWHFHMAAGSDPERSSSICVLRGLIGYGGTNITPFAMPALPNKNGAGGLKPASVMGLHRLGAGDDALAPQVGAKKSRGVGTQRRARLSLDDPPRLRRARLCEKNRYRAPVVRSCVQALQSSCAPWPVRRCPFLPPVRPTGVTYAGRVLGPRLRFNPPGPCRAHALRQSCRSLRERQVRGPKATRPLPPQAA